MSLKSALVSLLLSILAILTRSTHGLQLHQRGLSMMTSEQEFEVYSTEKSPYRNETGIRFENIGFGAAAFEVEAGQNFTLLCLGPRQEGFSLGWTSNSFQYLSKVRKYILFDYFVSFQYLSKVRKYMLFDYSVHRLETK